MEGETNKKGESKMLNFILKLFGYEVKKDIVQKWPCAEVRDLGLGRKGHNFDTME